MESFIKKKHFSFVFDSLYGRVYRHTPSRDNPEIQKHSDSVGYRDIVTIVVV